MSGADDFTDTLIVILGPKGGLIVRDDHLINCAIHLARDQFP
jgi:hypothetical protein